MHHHVYTTEGIIIATRPDGESSCSLEVMTRDFGLIRAHAQSVRSISSKLRYGLSPYSHSHISLVKGKNMWRVVNAQSSEDFYRAFKGDRDKLKVSIQILHLIRKLLPAEEKNAELFDLLVSGFTFLKDRVFEQASIETFERLLNLRIVHMLGYGGAVASLKMYSEEGAWNEPLLKDFFHFRKEAVDHINKALKASHLV